MNTTTTPGDWRILIPVKGGPQAKSRLNAPDGVDHGSLATALALDTVAAAVAAVSASQVIAVTSDEAVTELVGRLGVRIVADPGGGLNSAIRAGLDVLAGDDATGPVGVLLGDLPAARPEDLLRALAESTHHHRAFVPDSDGMGTVLLTGSSASALVPHFGTGSAAAHEHAGHTRLALDLPGLRNDVDDEASLRSVLCLGVGTHTARLLAHLITPS